jgi:hypothetical protein
MPEMPPLLSKLTMYGKYHASTFTGSMRGAGCTRFAVWGWVIANTNRHSVVEINPEILAFLLGCSIEEVVEAVEYLCAPDPKSRCKDHDGRRLLKEGEFQYLVPTHEHYRKMKTTEEKKEYNRVKKQEQRARESNDVKPSVKNVNGVNTSDTYPRSESFPQTPEELFEKFWEMYPRKEAKKKALEIWRKIKPSEYPAIMAALPLHNRKTGWLENGGKYIPFPTTWLNQRRWEDVISGGAPSAAPTEGELDQLERQMGERGMHFEDFRDRLNKFNWKADKSIAELRAHFQADEELI